MDTINAQAHKGIHQRKIAHQFNKFLAISFPRNNKLKTIGGLGLRSLKEHLLNFNKNGGGSISYRRRR
jgi:hypothetical protein